MKKYKRFPMPVEAWDNFKKKQIKMNEEFTKLTGKKKQIPLSRIILATSKKPLYFDYNELIKLSKRTIKI